MADTLCPACHGQCEREHRVYAAGVSPYDSRVKCDLCLGVGTVTGQAAQQWRDNPTIPPLPRRPAHILAYGARP